MVDDVTKSLVYYHPMEVFPRSPGWEYVRLMLPLPNELFCRLVP